MRAFAACKGGILLTLTFVLLLAASLGRAGYKVSICDALDICGTIADTVTMAVV